MKFIPSYQSSEIKNLIVNSKVFKFGFQFLVIFIRAAISKIIRKKNGNYLSFYPPHIRSYVKNIKEPFHDTFNLSKDNNSPALGKGRLKLAIGYMDYIDFPDWNTKFGDTEQFLSLHRWNWLLRSLTDESVPPSIEWGTTLIRSWIKNMTMFPGGAASESYTIGERISNASLYYRIHTGGWGEIPEDILNAIDHMAYGLSTNIEYHPSGMSGNHVINNARGLLFASYTVNKPIYRNLSMKLLKERLPHLVDDTGFFREGSTHYHFLLLRWLIEIRFVASEFNDMEICNFVNKFIPSMLNICMLFLVSDTKGNYMLPLIGDVSPDCEPDWIKYLPWSNISCYPNIEDTGNKGVSGWSKLFSSIEISNNTVMPAIKMNHCEGMQRYESSGWFRLDAFGWTAIWHGESSMGNAIASHAHHDLCSFVLYLDGREVIIDPGRYSYDDNLIGKYGEVADSHSTVKIGGVSPMLSLRDRFYPKSYRDSTLSFKTCEDAGKYKVVITHDGFSRLVFGKIFHKRSFSFSDGEVEVVDDFDGHGEKEFDVIFQWADIPKFKNNVDKIDVSNSCLKDITFTIFPEQAEIIKNKVYIKSNNPIAGWRFPSYGKMTPSVSQVISITSKLPVTFKYVLKVA